VSQLFEQLQTTLGDAYRLERELGGGGMSRVFLAHEVALGRRVVIKVLLPELAAGVSVDRFRREIQLAAQLQHPHIVPLLSAGESNGLPYFTMPYIDGETLGVKLARTGELPVSETVRILRDVASALAYAHEKGIMHRDVKPGNVLISGGVAVVTDFGVAKAVSASTELRATRLTSVGVALGTPAYMAPEQASGDPNIDHRADIYALGVVTYEMLAGRPPFWGRVTTAVLAAHVVETPEPIERLRPAIPPMLASLVMQCLAKRAADRPQSAVQLIHVLDTISTPTGGMAPTTVMMAPAAEPKSRRRWIALGAGFAAVLLLAAGGFLWQRNRANQPRPTAAPVPLEAGRATAARDSTPAPAQAATPPPPVRTDAVPADSSVATNPPARTPKPRRPKTHARSPAIEKQRTSTALESAKAESTPLPAKPAEAAPQPAATAETPAETIPERPAPAPVSPVAPSPSPPPPPPAPQPPADPTPDVRAVIDAYGSAVESQNIDNIRRLYPGLTPAQQRGWQQFFQTVRDVKAQLTVANLDVSNGTAEAQVTGLYTYLNNSTRQTEQLPVAFHMSLKEESGSWRIVQVR
jgi:tRNA A-37 threonylcarbamoyl transferase component Bud32